MFLKAVEKKLKEIELRNLSAAINLCFTNKVTLVLYYSRLLLFPEAEEDFLCFSSVESLSHYCCEARCLNDDFKMFCWI